MIRSAVAAATISVALVALVPSSPATSGPSLEIIQLDSGRTPDGHPWVRFLFVKAFPPGSGVYSWFVGIFITTDDGQFQYTSQRHAGKRTRQFINIVTGERIGPVREYLPPDGSLVIIMPIPAKARDPFFVATGERPTEADTRIDDTRGSFDDPLRLSNRVGDPVEIFGPLPTTDQPPTSEPPTDEPATDEPPTGEPTDEPPTQEPPPPDDGPTVTDGGGDDVTWPLVLADLGMAVLAFGSALASRASSKEGTSMGGTGTPSTGTPQVPSGGHTIEKPPQSFNPKKDPFPQGDIPDILEWKLDVLIVSNDDMNREMQKIGFMLALGLATIIGLLAAIAGALTALQGLLAGIFALLAFVVIHYIVPMVMERNREKVAKLLDNRPRE